jgi:hypothetical protein
MDRNLSVADRIIRIILSAAISVMILTGVLHGTAGVAAGILAVFLFATSIAGSCPLYRSLGIRTPAGKGGAKGDKEE